MKTIKIKKSHIFLTLAISLLACQYYLTSWQNRKMVISSYVITRITCPVSVINIENKHLTPEQVKIEPLCTATDSIGIYHLYSGYKIPPTLALHGDTLQILPVNMGKTRGISLKSLGNLYLNPNKNQQKIFLNGKEIWSAPVVSDISETK